MVVHKLSETEAWIPTSWFPDWKGADSYSFHRRLPGEDTSGEHEDHFPMSLHSFLVQMDGRNTLIDPCCGNHKVRPNVPFANMLDTDFLAQLASLGVGVEDVHAVYCTHMHFDHVGWNTILRDGKWVPTFPNARYYFNRSEIEGFAASGMKNPVMRDAFADSVVPIMEAGQAELVDALAAGAQVSSGVCFEHAPGHTIGNCMVHARGGGGHALFSGDVIHHPLQIAEPLIPMRGQNVEYDLPQSVATRLSVVRGYADTDTIFFPGHFPDPTAGHIISEAGKYRYRFTDG